MADLRIVDAPVLLKESITDDVKMPTGGLGNYAIRLGDLVWYVVQKEQLANKNYVDLSSKGVQDKLDVHVADKNNPHKVTKEQVGLGNVDNTADIDKPVSNAVSSAIITATNDMATKAYVNSRDGDLTTLTTTDKTSLVKAINEVVSVKANKATTLVEYGISDAYTKSEIDTTYNGVKTLYDKNVVAGAGENGWIATLVKDASGLTQQQINDYTHVKTPEIFGAKGKLNDDKAVFANLNPDYIFALGKEYTMDVWRSPARVVQGNNTTIHLNSASGTDTTVALQIPNGANYSDINFVNNPDSNLAWSYGTCGNDAILTNIGFYNFIDTNSYNSWGLYLSNRKNITLNSPKFGNNSLADIAIVDDVSNITINNAFNTVNPDGIILDIEPNEGGNIENINVVGGKYSHIYVLENSYQSNGIKGVNITGATVKLLELRGGQVKVSGGIVAAIKGSTSEYKDYADLQNAFFGQLEIDNVNLSKNLIADDKVLSFSGYEPSSFWSLYAPDTVDTKTIYDSDGFYTALNATKQSSHQQLTTRNYIDLPTGITQVATMIGYSVDNATGSLMFEPVLLSFFDGSGNLIGKEVSIKGGRTLPGTKYPWVNEVSICEVPSNATKFKIGVRSNKKGSTLNIRKIGVHTVSMSDVKGNFNAVMQSYAQPNLTKSLKAQQALSYSINANAVKYTEKIVFGAKLGDTVQVSTTSPIGKTSRIWAEISADNTLAIYHQNLTDSALPIDTTANFTIQ